MYQCGLYLGRFQPFHDGHKSIINMMLEECKTVIIAIGSSNKENTIKNPFPYGLRKAVISDCFPTSNVKIIPIPDRNTCGNDESWGDYVLNICKEFGYEPDVIYQGYEEVRKNWWNNFDGKIITVPRTVNPISATLIREALKNDDNTFFKSYTPWEMWRYYDILRGDLIRIYDEA